MKIVHIHQYYNDGMGYQENILPKYQSKYGHDVIMITSTLTNGFIVGNKLKNIREYTDNNFKVKRIGIKGEFRNRFVIFKDLYSELEKIKPDYIYHHSATAPSLNDVCKYKKNNKEVFLVVDNHADLNISGRNFIWKILYYNTFWNVFNKIYQKYIDLYFGVTPSRCLFLEEELGIDKEKIRLLPIGADLDEVSKLSSVKDLRKKYGFNNNEILIVHGGKITPEKQIDRIIEAFNMIEYSSSRLIIFGKIEDKKVEKLIDRNKKIVYLGWLDRKSTLEVLKLSDLGIWNTQHTTLMEDAIACELPMIIRYYGTTSHLIDNSGLYLFDGSTREIYEKIKIIIKNKDILNKYRIGIREHLKIISYESIAKESIEYKKDINHSSIFEKFMTNKYSYKEFEYFRKIKRN